MKNTLSLRLIFVINISTLLQSQRNRDFANQSHLKMALTEIQRFLAAQVKMNPICNEYSELEQRKNRIKKRIIPKTSTEKEPIEMNQTSTSIRKQLSGLGFKMTQQRKLIIDVLMTQNEPQTAEYLFQGISEVDNTIGLSTIYRTLKQLTNLGIVRCKRHEDGVARYECAHCKHCYLVCKGCGKRVPLDNPYMECVQREMAKQEGFTMVSTQMEIHGYCHECSRDRGHGCGCNKCCKAQ